MQSSCLYLNTCYQTLLTSHCRWKQKTIMHMKTKLKSYTTLTWSSSIMNWCNMQKCSLWCIITWLQQWSKSHQIIKCLVKLWTLSTKSTQYIWLLKLKKWLKLNWCKLCRTSLSWCWSLTLMQELTVVLTKQQQCKTSTLHKQLTSVVKFLKKKHTSQRKITKVSSWSLMSL